MESKNNIIARFLNWASTLHQNLFITNEELQNERQKNFTLSHQRMEDMHDKEMERLVKAIENTRDESSMRYH